MTTSSLGPQFDTFLVDVEHVGAPTDRPQRSRVAVSAESSTEARLVANQMVAARGRTPTKATVDWDNF